MHGNTANTLRLNAGPVKLPSPKESFRLLLPLPPLPPPSALKFLKIESLSSPGRFFFVIGYWCTDDFAPLLPFAFESELTTTSAADDKKDSGGEEEEEGLVTFLRGLRDLVETMLSSNISPIDGPWT